jgi:DNA adenine methylase/adenine-specific DNA-methyltransferase
MLTASMFTASHQDHQVLRTRYPSESIPSRAVREQLSYIEDFPADRIAGFPKLRFMGSKYRLLPWIHSVLSNLKFDTALDAFSGSSCVAYLLKAMGKCVTANDFLLFPATIARATVENSTVVLNPDDLRTLTSSNRAQRHFIERTFRGIFFTPADLRFLDRVSANITHLAEPHKRDVALSALIRACVKRQPRGVFTVAGDPDRYKDGRRDLKLSIEEHFLEQVAVYNRAVFANGRLNRTLNQSVFEIPPHGYDLVYFDPPYVPRSDDNCYVKRYHFLEGLACYWQGVEILAHTRVKKLAKPYTPFSYRREATAALDKLFSRFRDSILVLSYSSNGYPDLSVIVELMRRHKDTVNVYETEHSYHFGTHAAVRRGRVQEYLIVGS